MLPSKDKIVRWKKEYGKIYQVELSYQPYVYRQPTIGECESLQKLLLDNKTDEVDDVLVTNCLLFPEDVNFDNKPAGVVAALSQAIMSSAGFFDGESFQKMLDEAGKETEQMFQNDFFVWKLIIMQTLPGYRLKDLEALPPYEFFKLVRICEKLRGETLIQPDIAAQSQEMTESATPAPGGEPQKSSNYSFLSADEMKNIADDNSEILPDQQIIESYRKIKEEGK